MDCLTKKDHGLSRLQRHVAVQCILGSRDGAVQGTQLRKTELRGGKILDQC